MERILAILRQNRFSVGVIATALVVGAIAFPLLIGLSSIFALALIALVAAATLGIYRLRSGAPIVWDQPLSQPKITSSAIVGLVAVSLAIQLVPFGWDRSNPPVTAEPEWDSARTRELTVRACFDCHSNEVDYPWYSRIAPMSWAVQLHVEQGRSEVNYSEWDRPQDEADESAETVIDGEMPPGYYTLLTHSEARLTDTELQELIDGLEATFGSAEDDD